jgi:hypothetical protein
LRITEVDLDRLLTSVTEDTATARIHWRLAQDLGAAVPKWRREFAQSRAFWSLTISAHRDVTLFRLGRLYDQTPQALSLPSLLRTIQAHPHFFDEPSFRRRLSANPCVDSLAGDARRPDPATLAAHLGSVTKKDPLVLQLVDVRNTALAHRDTRVVLGTAVDPAQGLTANDVGVLLDRAKRIVNEYGLLFRAGVHSMRIIGEDDFLSVLHYVRKGLKSSERSVARQVGRLKDGKK